MLKIVLSLVSDVIAYRRAIAGGRPPSGLGHVSIWPVEPPAPIHPAPRPAAV